MDINQLSFIKQRDAEHLFAAAVHLNPTEAIKLCGWLSPRDILDERVARYWQAVQEQIEPTADSDTAIETSMRLALEYDLGIDIITWAQDLGYNYVPQAYATEIARRKYLSDVGSGMSRLITALSAQDDQLVKQVVQDMASQNISSGVSIPNAISISDKFADAVVAGKRSIDTFIPGLDSTLGGLERQTLTILAARPSMGKTALCLQIARNAAQAGHSVVFFSLEMSAISLWARAACPLVKMTWRDVRAGKLSIEQQADLTDASYSLGITYGDRLLIADTPQSTETVWRTVAELKPDLVVADHLRLFKDKGDSEVKRQGLICERLKDIAKAFNVPVLCAAQLNRGVESRNDKRPTLSDLRDSGEIEETADVVLMMYRDSYYNPPEFKTDIHPTEIWVRKFRDGPANVLVNLHFDVREEWFK